MSVNKHLNKSFKAYKHLFFSPTIKAATGQL